MSGEGAAEKGYQQRGIYAGHIRTMRGLDSARKAVASRMAQTQLRAEPSRTKQGSARREQSGRRVRGHEGQEKHIPDQTTQGG